MFPLKYIVKYYCYLIAKRTSEVDEASCTTQVNFLVLSFSNVDPENYFLIVLKAFIPLNLTNGKHLLCWLNKLACLISKHELLQRISAHEICTIMSMLFGCVDSIWLWVMNIPWASTSDELKSQLTEVRDSNWTDRKRKDLFQFFEFSGAESPR